MRKIKSILLVSSLFLVTAIQAQVDIKSQSLQSEKTEKGVKWVEAKTVIPGTIIRYVNTISNDNEKVATNLEVVNHISKHMELVSGTVKCEGGCDITYAVNLKEGYKSPSNLYVIDKKTGKSRLAMAKEYVSIKWVINTLERNKSKMVQYESKLK